jgi:hypothetical protein
MDDWVRAYRHELDGDGVDPDELLEETKRRADESRRNAWQLFERFLRDVAGLASEGPSSSGTESTSDRRTG